MKQFCVLFPLVCLLSLVLPEQLVAEINMDINGSIQTDHHVRLEEQEISRSDSQFRLKFEGAPSDYYRYFSEVRLKAIRESEDQARQWNLDLREAFLDLYEFGFDRLDVRIGKQIIAWGTADRLNPTSNICPNDFSDTFDFGEKLGVNAVQATFYLPFGSLAGIVVPEFTAAALPTGDLASAFGAEMTPPPGMTFQTITQHTIPPERTLDESSQFAAKLSTMLLGYDVTMSYYYGRYDLPLPETVLMTPVDAMGTVDVEIDLSYPRVQVVGADLAGAIGSVGIWAEGALFLPEKVETETILQTPGEQQSQGKTGALEDEAYLKYVLGMDYTFEGGWYMNAQFLHGFFSERGKEALNDYVLGRIEKDFMHDELKIVPFGVAVAVTDWDDVGDNYGFAGMPEITYYPDDNVEVSLGVIILEGKGQNMFSQLKDNDEVFIKVKVSF